MGAVNTTYTFTATDTITSTKMNNIIDETTMTSDAIDGTTLQVVSGKLKIRSQGVTSNEMGTSSVTTTNLVNGSITPAKLSTGAPNWNTSGGFTVNGGGTELSSITSGSAIVSIGKARTANGSSYIDFNAAFPVTSYETRIIRGSGANGSLQVLNNGTGGIYLDSATGPIVFNDVPLGDQSGDAPIYGARAFAKLQPINPTTSSRTTGFKSGSYTRTTTSTTVDIVGHGLKDNDKIRLDFTSGTGTDGLYTVTSAPTANQFVVNHTGTATSGSVTAEFVVIQGGRNISTASWYDSGTKNVLLNFITPMEGTNYTTMVTGQHYPGAWVDVGAEDTLGTTQLNTRYQCHVMTANGSRFLNVVIFA